MKHRSSVRRGAEQRQCRCEVEKKLRTLGLVSRRVQIRSCQDASALRRKHSNGRISPLRFFADYSTAGQYELRNRVPLKLALFWRMKIKNRTWNGSPGSVSLVTPPSIEQRFQTALRSVSESSSTVCRTEGLPGLGLTTGRKPCPRGAIRPLNVLSPNFPT